MNGLILRRRAKMETLIDLAAKLPQCIVVSFMRWLLHFYNLGNFLRTLAAPEPIKDWSMTTLKEKLIKIGAKVVSHGRYVAFQMAGVAIPRNLFADILRMIVEYGRHRLRQRHEAFDCHAFAANRGEVRLDNGKRNILGRSARRWPAPAPVGRLRLGSGLPIMPSCPRFGLQERVIRRMQDQLANRR